MNQRKPRIYKKLSLITLAALNAFALLAMVPPRPAAAATADCSDVYTPLSSFVQSGVNNNKSFYLQAQDATGVPWEMLAAIHYRETNFSHTNPSNGQGIFQFVNGDGGPYPTGPVSDGEFVRQLTFMANRLQSDYAWRGSIPRERRKLIPNEPNEVIVKDTLFSYNGRSIAYANQGAQWGYNPNVQPYEGSPYVMNRFDCDRARMPMITRDFGPIDGTDTRYGAFTIYARLRGESYWQSMWSPYAWAIDSFTYSGGDNIISQGQTDTVTLKARNTGKNPWYNHGDGPVRLGTWEPARPSTLANGSWLNNIRPANMQESVVLPGEIGTFSFQVTANQVATVVEGLNLVVENQQWMRWPGFSPTIVMTGAYAWQVQDVIYEKGTGLMEPGSTQLITLKAKNTGSTTWSKASGPPVRVGTWEPGRPSSLKNQNWLSNIRVTDMNETTVAPGQVAGFQFYITAPMQSGNYYERFNLVAEGQTWLNDPGFTLYTRAGAYAWQPVWTSLSTGTTDIPRNTTFTMTIRAKNTGDLTWRNNGYAVRLGTAAPLNRGSALRTPSWLNDIRPATLIESSVAPGQEGTFSFQARAPDVPGAWPERFNLVAEGLTWFVDNHYGVTINVK